MAAEHPSNDIAANIGTYFVAPTVEDSAMQAKLDGLVADYKTLADKVVADVCDCADRATALQRLRDSLELSVSAVVNEPANDSPDWPPVPSP